MSAPQRAQPTANTTATTSGCSTCCPCSPSRTSTCSPCYSTNTCCCITTSSSWCCYLKSTGLQRFIYGCVQLCALCHEVSCSVPGSCHCGQHCGAVVYNGHGQHLEARTQDLQV